MEKVGLRTFSIEAGAKYINKKLKCICGNESNAQKIDWIKIIGLIFSKQLI